MEQQLAKLNDYFEEVEINIWNVKNKMIRLRILRKKLWCIRITAYRRTT